uniref:GTPase IMAP family member 8-like n=1 Tax=Poecilia reticulata TaxID=8081 RepID=A0A3P9MXI2_POERE
SCIVNVTNNVENLTNKLRIVLIGGKSHGSLSGKSSTGNFILGQNVFDTSRRTTQSEVSHGVVEGRRLTVVDSPGWFCINTLQETSEMDKLEIENSVNLCPPGPHAVLLVIPVIMSIDESYLRSILKPLTERVWRHCMVLFTWGDWINDIPVENYIVREGKELQELLEKCGDRYHVLNPKHSDYSVQVKELFQKIDMVKQNTEFFTIKMEKEQKRREQGLIQRMMKALAKEPEEQTVHHVRTADSKDDRVIPDSKFHIMNLFSLQYLFS